MKIQFPMPIALKERESVKAIAHSKEFYIERYAKFAAPTLAAV